MKKNNKINIFLFLFLGISLLYPIILIICKISWQDFVVLIESASFKEALLNSIEVTTISTIISVLLASILSYSLSRTNIKYRALLKVLLTLPMLVPSISHGIGLINLFGNNGLITQFLKINIIGPKGIILGSVIYGTPVAFLIIDDGLNYINNQMYDTAKVLGLSKWQTFKKVTMCYMQKPALSAIFATFALIFSDYGIPLVVGGKFLTLSVFLYKEVLGLLNYSKGIIISLFLLVPAIASFIINNYTKDYSSEENKSNSNTNHYKSSKLKDISLGIFVYVILIFVLLLLGSFIYYAFIDNFILNKTFSIKHINYVFNNNITKNLFNSLYISIISAVFGTIIAYTIAYNTARNKARGYKILHMLTITSISIPGMVLGLSYIISFNNTIIYNTYIILILVNIIHFLASPYLMAYNALSKVNNNYECIAKTCNINKYHLIKDIIIPCTKQTIREMFSYFFVNSMVTISAITFLFNTKTMPLSLLINEYENSMLLSEAAIISLIILIINLIVKCTIYLINRKERRKCEKNDIQSI